MITWCFCCTSILGLALSRGPLSTKKKQGAACHGYVQMVSVNVLPSKRALFFTVIERYACAVLWHHFITCEALNQVNPEVVSTCTRKLMTYPDII